MALRSEPAGNDVPPITLRDGRRIGVASFGIDSGVPVFYFHGFPASRLEARLAHAAAVKEGVRLLALDRPGYGRSDYLSSRTLASWPNDVVDVAEALAIRRFGIVGVSGGAPYALACAAALPERVTAIGLVGGLGMTTIASDFAHLTAFARASFSLARSTPAISRLINRPLGGMLHRYPDLVFAMLAAGTSRPDRETLADAQVFAVLVASLREALRGGSAGASQELKLYARPWDFDVTAVRVPCYLWHGEADKTVPVEMGRRLAGMVPGCRATFLADEGHFSLPLRHSATILAMLARHA